MNNRWIILAFVAAAALAVCAWAFWPKGRPAGEPVAGDATASSGQSVPAEPAAGSPSPRSTPLTAGRLANPDSDGDGLPDWWEMRHFGNLAQGPADDPDGDGFVNHFEFHAGGQFVPNKPNRLGPDEQPKFHVTIPGRAKVHTDTRRMAGESVHLTPTTRPETESGS